MIVGEVIGNVWATRKESTLSGLKFMVVRYQDPVAPENKKSFVAVDCVGAGTGEQVLVVTGSSARMAIQNEGAPVDAAIVGIVDEVQVISE
ncbi:EutN/CcmL family microcompartment protein [Photobacterium alginatilyticum]|uniref:Ethanolamine utilization protein EutN n=1 Tax=Photobacterium alginatilyticum TaxID=1775171 RepID=A0ABW9YQ56_9GAMM|nr:EutN/CcmL family microcompartment protein [Photobacterium alginatilyticum]NBI56067.1 ethanolamine utilization protein EutN [Photobacterium alginatilyticum]